VEVLLYSLFCPFTFSVLGPNISPSTLFANTFTFCSSQSMRDRVSYPYETTREIAVLYVLLFVTIGNKGSATLCFTIRRCETLSLEANAFGGIERNSCVTRFICWSSRRTNCKIFITTVLFITIFSVLCLSSVPSA
jgi:hypothetical protein